MTQRTQHRKRGRYASSSHRDVDWQSIYDDLTANHAQGAITRAADRYGVNRRTLSDRWHTYQRAVSENDEETQRAMLGMHDRRRDNHRAVPRIIEQQTIDTLLLTNPAPTRADVSAAMVDAHNSLPVMQHVTRSTPLLHSNYSASDNTVTRIIRQHKVVHKKIKLKRRRVREVREEEKEDQLHACLSYLEDVEHACDTHGRHMVINVDETAVRTINTRTHALARKGEWETRRPVMEVTRSDRECTSLICAVAADGSKLRPCALKTRRGEAALSRDSRWEVIRCGGWTNADVYMEYIWRVILPYTQGQAATVVHDSLSAHHTEDVSSFLLCHNLFPINVPPKQTNTLQPLDVGVFGPLKAQARHRWNEEKQKNRQRADSQYVSMSIHVDVFNQMHAATVTRGRDSSACIVMSVCQLLMVVARQYAPHLPLPLLLWL
jgi:hypothetical protein